MITVTVGTNTDQHDVAVNPNSTLKSVLTQEKINYSQGALYLNGAPLKPADIDKTFTDFNVATDCMLICVVKSTGGK